MNNLNPSSNSESNLTELDYKNLCHLCFDTLIAKVEKKSPIIKFPEQFINVKYF